MNIEIYIRIITAFILLFMSSAAIFMAGDMLTKALGNIIFAITKGVNRRN